MNKEIDAYIPGTTQAAQRTALGLLWAQTDLNSSPNSVLFQHVTSGKIRISPTSQFLYLIVKDKRIFASYGSLFIHPVSIYSRLQAPGYDYEQNKDCCPPGGYVLVGGDRK